MSTAQKWTLDDTFDIWLAKYNTLVDSADGLVSYNFKYLSEQTVGRVVKFTSGKVRDAGVVTIIPATTITIPTNTEVVIGILKDGDVSRLDYFILNGQPTEYFVALFTFKTDTYNVVSYVDLTTEFAYDRFGTDGEYQSSILMLDRNIIANTLIPNGKGAISVAPIIADGVVVTVETDAEWVIL